MIEVVKAPPFATVQDLGWRVGRRFGLPRSGAMDPPALRQANRALGNPEGTAALEWALGAGRLRFGSTALVCVTRGALARAAGGPARGGLIEVPAGSELEVVPGGTARFGYLAVRGGIAVPTVMGSRSTYLPGGFGGHQGRRLQAGDLLPIGGAPAAAPAGWDGDGESPEHGGQVTLRAMPGPQWERFGAEARQRLFGGHFVVSPSADRMGYRLAGPALPPLHAATLPSEPACIGAVQVPDGGEPIVLMPDGPTVGGYPKIAVVLEADLPALAQCQPGRTVRFTPA